MRRYLISLWNRARQYRDRQVDRRATNASGPQVHDQVGRSHLNQFDLIRTTMWNGVLPEERQRVEIEVGRVGLVT